MKRISLWFLVLTFTVCLARGQDGGTQQQLDQINGRLQDLIDAQALQAKRLTALEKEIAELRDKSGSAGAGASQEDLQKLATQVQDLAKKQQADNDLILKEIGKLGKVSGAPAGRKPTPNVTPLPPTGGAGSAAGGKESGYEYKVAEHDTLSSIAKAYRDQGIKVTTDQILKANPGLDAKNLKVGQKIFIPAPAQ
jgi:LysM repeat protein